MLLKQRRSVLIINYVCRNYGSSDNETGDTHYRAEDEYDIGQEKGCNDEDNYDGNINKGMTKTFAVANLYQESVLQVYHFTC